MVIPRFRSSGALSIAPYSRKLAKPISAWRFVMAAVNVVWAKCVSIIHQEITSREGGLFHDQRDQLCLFRSANIPLRHFKVDGTYIDVGLRSLESGRKSSHSTDILAKDLLEWIATMLPPDRVPTCPEKWSDRSRDGWHIATRPTDTSANTPNECPVERRLYPGKGTVIFGIIDDAWRGSENI